MKTLVIIPAYNEDKTIKKVIIEVQEYTRDILVINDGSIDNTKEILSTLAVNVINNKQNLGKGISLNLGFKYAIKQKYDSVIILDGDGEHDPKYIPTLIKESNFSDIVFTQRKIFRNKRRFLLNRFATFWFKFFIPELIDIYCGYKLIKVDLLKKINLYGNTFEIELEIILEAIKNHAKIKLIDIETKPINKTHFKFKHYIKSNNIFDEWILKNYKNLQINNFIRIFLLIAAIIGLPIGKIILRLLR